MTTKTKKPSLQAQLKAATAAAAEHKAHADKLQKELDSAKQVREHYSNRADKADAELQQIHAFLDAVPNPPARKTDPAVTGGYSADNIGALTRLSVFLATRGF